MTVQQVLDASGIDPREARLLLAAATGFSEASVLAHPERELAEETSTLFRAMVTRRAAGEPVAYILGRKEFYGLELTVNPAVLVPRPETELLVDLALARKPASVLDVGTGSGALAVTLRLETGAATWATDISPAAASVAIENARGLGAEVRVVVCDLMAAIRSATMDLIVSNPPYVPAADEHGLQREVRDWEPHVALFAGETGFELYERIVADAPRVLRPGGWLVMELGFGSHNRVAEMLSGWENLRIEPDLAGIPRVIAAQRGERAA